VGRVVGRARRIGRFGEVLEIGGVLEICDGVAHDETCCGKGVLKEMVVGVIVAVEVAGFVSTKLGGGSWLM
jgi:hypothetical protein